MNKKSKTIIVRGTEISVIRHINDDYISFTDMVKNFEDSLSLIEKWLRNNNTVEFIGIWKQINNPVFNSPEFEGFRKQTAIKQ